MPVHYCDSALLRQQGAFETRSTLAPLTYADVCRRMPTYADVRRRMLSYADVCRRMLTHASRRTHDASALRQQGAQLPYHLLAPCHTAATGTCGS